MRHQDVVSRLRAAGLVGQAGRIQGVTPAAISLLLVWLKRRELAARAGAAGDAAASRKSAA